MLQSTSPRQSATSPRRVTFEGDQLRAYIRKLLQSTLQNSTWPEPNDHSRLKMWANEIGTRVKERMLEIQSKGFKYIVMTQINENLGQGGRGDMACHWEEGDVVVQEYYMNDSLICTCVALAIVHN